MYSNHRKKSLCEGIFFISRLLILFLILTSASAWGSYRVVIDPGHGGKYAYPSNLFGDKCDPLALRCISDYRGGAEKWGYRESDEVYEIAKQIKNYLDLLNTSSGRKKFSTILKKYSAENEEIHSDIEVFLSRKSNYQDHYPDNRFDFNADYRLFDFEDKVTGKKRLGTVSRINRVKPHLVVSLHLTPGAPSKYGGMAAVITPGYDTYSWALQYVKADTRGRSNIRNKFNRSPYRFWMRASGYSGFESFICDSWVYFSGRWSKKNGLEPRNTKYRGYRQNWVTWEYSDDENWVYTALSKKKYTPYTPHLKYFTASGKFWEREKSKPERWRRENGYEGYGGDNYYAAKEIMRTIRKGFLISRFDSYKTLPVIARPYLSTWIVPTYINAISAYIELAHLNVKRDVTRVLYYKKVYAEAIAVGIYSLFYSTKQPATNKRVNLPTGRAIDFQKYETYEPGNYFEIVSD